MSGKPPRVQEEAGPGWRWALRAGTLFAVLAPVLLLDRYNSWYCFLGDEGVILNGARRLLGGELPYRDFYSILTPGSFYALAAVFKVLGTSLFSARLALWGCHAATALLLLALARELRLSEAWQTVGLCALALFGAPAWVAASHHWFANVPLLLSAWLWLRDRGRGDFRLLAAAGATAALTACTLQDKGTYWLAAVSLGMALVPAPTRLRPLGAFWAGALAVALPAGGFFLWKAGLRVLVQDLVVGPLARYHAGGLNQDAFGEAVVRTWTKLSAHLAAASGPRTALVLSRDLALGLDEVLLFGSVVLAGALVLIGLVRRPAAGEPRRRFAVLAALAAASLGTLLHHPAGAGFFWALPGVLLLVLAAADRAAARAPGRAWTGAAAVLVAVLALPAAVRCLVDPLLDRGTVVRFPAGTVRVLDRREIETLRLAAAFRAADYRPGDRVYGYLYVPTLLFLLDLPPDGHYDLFLQPLHTPEELRAHLAGLEADPPEWILYDRLRIPERDDVLAWIDARYRVVKVSDGLLVLRRREALVSPTPTP